MCEDEKKKRKEQIFREILKELMKTDEGKGGGEEK